MLTMPIPMVVALVLIFLFARVVRSGDVSPWLCALLFACAVQNAIVALGHYYGITGFRLVQPITASIVPPLTWIAFQKSAIRDLRFGQVLPHALVPLAMIVCVIWVPRAIDPALVLLFAVYGIMIVAGVRRADGDLPLARLEAGRLPDRLWLTIAGMLLLSAVSDLLIAVSVSGAQGWLQPWILSISSSLILLAIGLICLSPNLTGVSEDEARPQPINETLARNDADLVARLDALLREKRLYLDPDLTLARLARRLAVPVKQLSAAINRDRGENVSRYINAYRVAHARDSLQSGESVTNAMMASGFNTKSNFNREFLRITGQTPSQWRSENLTESPSGDRP